MHHISCGRFCPPLRPLSQGGGSIFERAEYVVHCLLLELPDRLVLVDTGLSRADMEQSQRRLGPGMALCGGASRGSTAREHVERLGYLATDVSDIVMTHLDKDHAGGLADFPQARVHVHQQELEAALARRTYVSRQRYHPNHFAHGPQWIPTGPDGVIPWHKLTGAFPLEGLPDTIRLVPLPGHTVGHCGVAVQLDNGSWLLHAGDAVYHSAWLQGRRPPLAIQMVERLLQADPLALRRSREVLIQLAQDDEVTVCTSHDRETFLRLGGSH